MAEDAGPETLKMFILRKIERLCETLDRRLGRVRCPLRLSSYAIHFLNFLIFQSIQSSLQFSAMPLVVVFSSHNLTFFLNFALHLDRRTMSTLFPARRKSEEQEVKGRECELFPAGLLRCRRAAVV